MVEIRCCGKGRLKCLRNAGKVRKKFVSRPKYTAREQQNGNLVVNGGEASGFVQYKEQLNSAQDFSTGHEQ